MGNVIKGIGSGLANLTGFGSLYNPVGDAEKKVASATLDLNEMVAQASLLGLQAEQKEIQALGKVVESNKQELESAMSENEEVIWEKMTETNYFLLLVALLVVIIVVYLVLQKN